MWLSLLHPLCTIQSEIVPPFHSLHHARSRRDPFTRRAALTMSSSEAPTPTFSSLRHVPSIVGGLIISLLRVVFSDKEVHRRVAHRNARVLFVGGRGSSSGPFSRRVRLLTLIGGRESAQSPPADPHERRSSTSCNASTLSHMLREIARSSGSLANPDPRSSRKQAWLPNRIQEVVARAALTQSYPRISTRPRLYMVVARTDHQSV